jgi:hypothetical protein
MFNPNIDGWHLLKNGAVWPDHDVPLFVLIEHDVVHNLSEQVPFARMATLHRYETEPKILYWRLRDYDPEAEEEILQQYYSVVAWRYVEPPPTDRQTPE